MKLIILSIFFFPALAFSKLQVATTTTDLASLVRNVGGDEVQVFAIAKGTQDPHQIEAKPSYMVKLRDSDLLIAHGLELESAWMGPLIQGARNPKLSAKGGVLELGAELDPIEISSASATRADGDVHPGGNPHFQLDPIRLGKAAVLIAHRLGDLDSGHRELYLKRAEEFQKTMAEKTKDWSARIKKSGVSEIVTYHKTFSYFCSRFSLICSLQLEPRPGIPPTAAHLISVINEMKKKKLKIILIENLYDDSVKAKILQAEPNAFIQRVPVSVGGAPGTDTNAELIEFLVKTLEAGSH